MKRMQETMLTDYGGWKQTTFNVLFSRKAISSIYAWLILEMMFNI